MRNAERSVRAQIGSIECLGQQDGADLEEQ
jgi:hypothetical protein